METRRPTAAYRGAATRTPACRGEYDTAGHPTVADPVNRAGAAVAPAPPGVPTAEPTTDG
ncbi:hypothetical protein CDG81_07165 [Actinopolyspora erythraea]|uniref:Uncharacterized protein n=1 Tax=Actinopolyspora erythraea TaxID=414996 RepID=A0A099D6L8_9ACTN|nr:hypothetical protein CDG81_07165 [Actinopolyspora erythraea]KGI81669.1 hypothetical protein IL38_09545 [Actinopolyspora erythraea]